MAAKPDVSVCIPAYNHGKYIRECITSVLNQDYKDLEVVITDDFSTDGTVNAILPFVSDTVRLFRNDKNCGPGAAANNSIRNSRGDFICYFNSDDAFLPSKIGKQRKVLDENPEIGAVFSFVEYMDDESRTIPGPSLKGNRSKESWLRLFFYEGNFLSAPTVMIRRSILDKIGLFDHRLVQAQDFDLWIRLCLEAEIHVIEEPLIRYRIRSEMKNLGSNTPEKRGRILWEMSKAMGRLCLIRDNTELIKIFPEARTGVENGLPLTMTLALLALGGQRWTRAFGIDLLYHAIQRLEDVQLLARVGVGMSDFFRMAAEADVFGGRAEAEIEARHDYILEEYEKLEASFVEQNVYVSTLQHSADEAAHHATEMRAEIERARHAADEAAHHATEMRAEIERARHESTQIAQRLAAIETSSIWRATRPLRRAGERFPRLARALRRGAKLAWWSVTLQLPRRYRLWRNRQLPRPTQDVVADSPLLLAAVTQPVEGLALASAENPVLDTALNARGAGTSPAQPAGIRVPFSPEPVVTVIISTYGQVGFTIACLRSIAAHAPRNPTEVIVVDDAYPDVDALSALRDVSGIRLTRNSANLGFLRSCNQAAKAAKGRYLYMLNNDTEIQPDSIDALVDLLDARPDVGMAGSKLLFLDGRLQEAGGILWTDASGWNFGRGDDPSRPEYNYVREVDYCSGASILVRRSVFEELGGFDERFVPAYYEDADLAFRIRSLGMKVLYEPRSAVVHHEGISHGTDLTVGVKAHQVANQGRMAERWAATLARENYERNRHILRARDRARTRKVILLIDHDTPQPDRDAGSRSVIGIMDSLLDAGWVVKLWPHNRLHHPVYTTAMERKGVEVIDERWPGDIDSWLQENGCELDHLLVVRPDVAADVLPHIMRYVDAVLSLYGIDLHFARMRGQAQVEASADLREEALSMKRLEQRLWRNFDVVFYPSEEEAIAVRELSPGSVVRSIVPFCCDSFPERTAPPSGRTILFVAGFGHAPNVDAAVFLIRDIIPLLEEEIGQVLVALAGSSPTEAVRALASPRVTVTGYVTDEELSTLYAQQRVSVVPLRFGAGVKGKVVESLARGLPLVTTSIGAQGIPGIERLVPVHDDVPGIVGALKLLLTDDDAWLTRSAAQMAFAQRLFSRSAMRASVLEALDAGEEAARQAAAAPTDHRSRGHRTIQNCALIPTA